MKFPLVALALLTLTLSSCATQPGVSSAPAPIATVPAPVRVAPSCQDCGRVERIESVQVPAAARRTARSGAVLGGIVGGVITGPAKPASTAAPVMQRVSQIAVRMDDGRRLVLRQNVISPDLRPGSRVRVTGGRVVLLR
jgi:outer membrane lipoprotein SlyB